MKLRTTGDQRVSYENRSWYLWYAEGLFAFGFLFAAWLTLSGIRFGFLVSTNPVARTTFRFMLVPGLLLLAFAAWALFAVLQTPLTLTTEALVIRRGFRRVRIAVQDIAGVGLVFERSNPASLGYRALAAWCVMVWRSDGHGERAGVLSVPFNLRDSRPGRGRRRLFFNTAHFDPVTGTDAGQLALTHAGQVARDIYDRVLSLQGPSGLLATKQLQKHLLAPSPWAGMPITAFWSPDGVLGYAGHRRPGPKAEPS